MRNIYCRSSIQLAKWFHLHGAYTLYTRFIFFRDAWALKLQTVSEFICTAEIIDHRKFTLDLGRVPRHNAKKYLSLPSLQALFDTHALLAPLYAFTPFWIYVYVGHEHKRMCIFLTWPLIGKMKMFANFIIYIEVISIKSYDVVFIILFSEFSYTSKYCEKPTMGSFVEEEHS